MKILLILLTIISLNAQDLKKVSLQLQWKYQFQFAGYIIAKEKGFYKEKNLEVKIKEWNHAINMVNEVENGNSEFAIARPTSMIDISKGKDIIYLATIFQSSPLVLLTDKSTGIKSIKDFVNKRIMTTGDLNTDTSIIAMMFSQGVNIKSLKTQSPSFNPKDLLDGKTDIMSSYISNEPFILKELGGSPIIFSPKNYGFNFYNDIIITSNKYLLSNQQEVEDFTQQTLKGWEYAFSHIDETVDIIFNKYNTQNKSKKALRYEALKLKELAYFESNKIGLITEAKLEKIYDTYKLLGLAQNNIDFNKIIHKNSFLYNDFSNKEKEYLDSKEYLSVMSLRHFEPFNFRKDNEAMGYSIEMIKLMGEVLNKKIKFIKKPWNEQVNMLKNGEIDIIPHLGITKERKEFIDYTNFSHVSFIIGFALNKKDSIESMEDLKSKTVGVVNGYFMHKHLEKYFQNIKIKVYKSTEEAIKALSTGDVFTVIDNIPTLNYFIEEKWLSNIKISKVKDFGMPIQVGLPMGVRKGNIHLKSILEKTNSKLPKVKIKAIRQAWIGDVEYSAEHLSLKEEEFIRNKKTIKFLVNENKPPFEFVQNKEAKGMAVDYIKLIAQKHGFEVKFIVENISNEDALELFIDGTSKYDSKSFMLKNQSKEMYFSFGDSYLSYPSMIITNKDSSFIGKLSDLNNKSIVIEKNSILNSLIRKDFPDINIIEVETTKDALSMLSIKLADAYVGNIAIANYTMLSEDFNMLKITAPTKYGNIDYNFVAPNNIKILSSILSKGYKQLSQKEHNAIQQKWFSVQTIEKTDYKLVWKILIGFTLVFVWFVWWNRKLSLAKLKVEESQRLLEEKHKELIKISNTDRLTGINNRLCLDQALEHEFNTARRYKKIFSIIIIDIDHFKKVNDEHGHLVGDKLLIEFTNILKSNIRNADMLARWGGEEFIVLCSQTDLKECSYLANILREKIENNKFSIVNKKTACFGVATYQNDLKIEDIIKRADDALYQAKETGRNKVVVK